MKLFLVLVSVGLAAAARVPNTQSLMFPLGLNRIVGGEEATLGEFPWQVSIREFADTQLLHICGGSILNEKWIITAAHCCSGFPSLFHVTSGDVDTLSDEGTEQHIEVEAIHRHPDYSSSGYANDICLLELAASFTFDEFVAPVALPEPLQQTDNGTMLTVTGFGVKIEGGLFPATTLMKVDVPVVADDVCKEAYSGFGGEVIDSMICAGYLEEGGFDACQGDSGGPYVISGSNVQVGVVSWGKGCAEAGYPGVNTEVSYFVDWIQETIGA